MSTVSASALSLTKRHTALHPAASGAVVGERLTSSERTFDAPKASSRTLVCVWRMYEDVENTARVRVSVPLSGPVSCLASDAGASSANAALMFNRPPRFCWRTVAHR